MIKSRGKYSTKEGEIKQGDRVTETSNLVLSYKSRPKLSHDDLVFFIKKLRGVVVRMAKNGEKGGGRIGEIKDRSQVQNPKNSLWVKRDTETGKFIDVKTSEDKPFKGVRREK